MRPKILNQLALAGLLMLSIAACQPQGLSLTEVPQDTQVAGNSTVTGGNCKANAETSWTAGDVTHTVEAATVGPSCPQAVVTLTVRGIDGAPELAWSARTQDIIGLYDAADVGAMEKALADWIDQSHNNLPTTSALPVWAAGKAAPGPDNEEFPFHAESWFDRETWEKLRKDNVPLFAFPQGRESMAVFIVRDGQFEPVGVQQFPG